MADDPEARIAELRRQLSILSAPRMAPVVSRVTAQAKVASQGAAASIQQQLLSLDSRIRAQPLSAVLLAAAAGYMFSRLRN